MRTRNGLQALLVVLTTSLVTACGGSGSSDSASTPAPPPPYTMTVDAASEIQDHSVLHVDISSNGGVGSETFTAYIRAINVPVNDGTGQTGVNATTADDSNDDQQWYRGIMYEPTDTGFAFHFAEIGFKQEDYRITVIGEKGEERIEHVFEVTVVNSTGNTWRDRAIHINRVAPAQRMFIAEMVMIERLAQAVRLTGGDIDTKDLMPMYIDAMHKDEDILDGLYGAITFPQRIERYVNGEIRWAEAFGSLQKAFSFDECEHPRCMNEYLRNIVPLFNYVIDQSQGAIARPSHGEVKFDNRTNTYSIFYVDGENGSFDESGNWSFKPELAYLADLIIAGNDAAYTFTEKTEQPDTDPDTDEDA